MVLKNRLEITDSRELAEQEEFLTKSRAKELFDTGLIGQISVGTWEGLSAIHAFLFQDMYDFAGKIRDVNLAKGGFRFAPVMYLSAALQEIEAMPQKTFNQIIEKYVEMNVAHPFREGNGRSMRIWLDQILKTELGQVIDWSKVSKEDYPLAMERSPIKDVELKFLLQKALTSQVDDRELYMKGINHSYAYEGYETYRTEDLEIKSQT